MSGRKSSDVSASLRLHPPGMRPSSADGGRDRSTLARIFRAREQLKTFLQELKSRRVYRVALGYIVAGWVVVQVATTVLPTFAVPVWVLQTLIILLALGFPVALVLAWAFEWRAGGLGRTEDSATAMDPRGNRRLVLVAAFGVLIGAVAVAGYWRWAPWKARPVAVQTNAPVAAAAPAPERSIAVLPFTNLSTEKENAFFTDGVHDEILTDLANVADLKVISRTSVMSYREAGEQRNLPEIARALGVANVLEGSVQRVAGRVRVTAQLIDARTDTHLWADKYDRDLTDVFAIQSEIANAIVTQLRAKLSPREQAAMHERSTSDMEAYDLYLRAKELRERSYSNLGNRGAANLEAVTLLEQATRRDPAFVRAWCLLARVHDTLYSMRNDPTSERRAMAEQAIESAARLQPNSAEVHLARAWHAYNAARDFETARKELALVIRDMPNLAEAYELTGYIDRREGREEDSNRNLQRALELDPRNIAIILGFRNNLTRERRFADAAKLLDGVLAWKPDDLLVRYERARIDQYWRADLRPVHAVLYSSEAQANLTNVARQRMNLAILERDYATAEKALAASSEAKFDSNGYVRSRTYFEGQIALAQGDQNRAQASFGNARLDAEAAAQQRPGDAKAWIVFGEVNALFGNKAEALRNAEQALSLTPEGRDALDRISLLEKVVVIYCRTGEKDRALQLLEELAEKPSAICYGELRLWFDYDALRGDPRFEALVARLAPKDAPH